MRAVVWHGKNDVQVDDVDDPQVEEPTDAIIRVTASGVCGSDLHLVTKLWPVLEEGDLLGHEAVGEVVEVGAEVSHVKAGDHVVIPSNVACGWCLQCQDRMYSQCETAETTPVRLGAQAEYLRVPQAHFGPIPVPDDGSDLRHVLLCDVLPTAWQAVEYAGVKPGDTVSVHGLGAIGQMAARIALHRGAARVIGVDQVPARLAMAARHGVETIDFRDVKDAAEAIADLTGGSLCHAAIDAVGMEASGSLLDSVLHATKVQPDKLAALHSALAAVRRGGTISIVGVYKGPFPMFPLGDLFDKQITLRMGQVNVKRWVDDLVPLLTDDADPLGLDDLVTHRMPFEQAPYAYEVFQKKMDGCVKVVLEPGGV
jgi:threonine dehydrogenase-like Zn-dependent dehydrogenase